MSLRFAVIADNSRNLNFYGEVYYEIIIPIDSGLLEVYTISREIHKK